MVDALEQRIKPETVTGKADRCPRHVYRLSHEHYS